ncbi:MAG: prepilin-type N-terminal cleavage/methylation domain-containing protein [Patescibacteria group bacterium]|nr:prepilin-type N-terminal cleavage/methylation domain-containing protein [Patescibacteria group bacterium]MDE1988264.1 prepilin-type N-terminal cleavage/methylation domain-containing protein [Patescibacteria group bacterium]MDE2218410.1 prepilin-type N-terminal cleavage/methylation domain-containing protein [Patescibacteria group bacterium]
MKLFQSTRKMSFYKNLKPTTYHLKPNRGFTMMEFVITLSILAVLAAIIFTSMSSFRNSKALQVVDEEALSLLDEARGDTLSAKDGYAYGIHFESSKIVLFRGTVYSSSDSSNKTVDVDGAVEIYGISLAGGGQDVLFQPLTAKTSQNGTVMIRLKSDVSKTKTILIESSGVASSN